MAIFCTFVYSCFVVAKYQLGTSAIYALSTTLVLVSDVLLLRLLVVVLVGYALTTTRYWLYWFLSYNILYLWYQSVTWSYQSAKVHPYLLLKVRWFT